MRRAQKAAIVTDLKKKMVFLTGPRQIGKTTLAKEIVEETENALYLNYDGSEDRKIIEDESWLPQTELLVLDEIHKMSNWKNYLKGIFDTKPKHLQLLITGSARLEIFNHMGDSLAGRYFLHRLMPLSPAECEQVNVPYTLDHFLERGGFPEPFLAKNETDANRWRQLYIDSMLMIDVLEFEKIQNIKAIKLIFELLRARVGSPLSYSSISEDVGVSPNTVKKYVHILEALYIVFLITPYSRDIARSLKKEPRIYFFDTGLVKGNDGIKFENLVATCLLKYIYGRSDYQAENYSLMYLQTKEKHEVDFALVKDQQIEKMIEVKHAETSIGKGMRYFACKYDLPAFQVVKNLKRERIDRDVTLTSGQNFLRTLV